MQRPVCVFVDGENFRHSICDLFEDEFDRNDHLPRNARWGDLFDWFVEQAPGGSAERLRTYWYVVQHMNFYPYSFPNPEGAPERLKRLLMHHKPFREELEALQGAELASRMKEIVTKLSQRKNIMRARFDRWTWIQNDICERHRSIEFRRAGEITYKLFDNRMGKEKAVDVKLATDLIMLRDTYDVAMIVSGDQDCVPALMVVKDRGKTVVNVAFETRDGRLLPRGARRLERVTDWSLVVPYDRMKSFLNLKHPDETLPLNLKGST